MTDRALESTVTQAQQILTELITLAEVSEQPEITRKLQVVVMALDLQRVELVSRAKR